MAWDCYSPQFMEVLALPDDFLQIGCNSCNVYGHRFWLENSSLTKFSVDKDSEDVEPVYDLTVTPAVLEEIKHFINENIIKAGRLICKGDSEKSVLDDVEHISSDLIALYRVYKENTCKLIYN
jgi:hypothetical protein